MSTQPPAASQTQTTHSDENNDSPQNTSFLPTGLYLFFHNPSLHRAIRKLMRWALIGFALYVVHALLWNARSALLPFVIGIVLAYLLLPLVNRLAQQMPRWTAILVVYLGSLLTVIAFFAYLVPPLIDQIGQLFNKFSDFEFFKEKAELLLNQYERILSSLPPEISTPIRKGIEQGQNQIIAKVQLNLTNYIQGIGEFIFNSVSRVINTVTFLLGFFLVPFWLFYVLLDHRAGGEFLNRLLPMRIRTDFWTVITITDRVLINYIRGQLFLGLVVGLAAGFGLIILNLFGLKIPYILVLAVFAGITELIPVIGPIIGAIPAIILGLFDSPTTALAVTLLYIAIQQLENQVLVPRIIGESVDIHPAILMLLLVIFSQVFGLLGAILCAPTAAIARDVFIYIHGRLQNPPRPAGVFFFKDTQTQAHRQSPPQTEEQGAQQPTRKRNKFRNPMKQRNSSVVHKQNPPSSSEDEKITHNK